jgi:hypothetical protein
VRGDWERYPFYLELLEEVKAHDERERHRSSSKKVAKFRLLSSGTIQKQTVLNVRILSRRASGPPALHYIQTLQTVSYQRRGVGVNGC